MTAALVDRLRALGPERARRILADVEADLGPEAIAALRYAPEFWLRPAQMVRPPYAPIEVFVGERGTGKSHAARELFVKLLPLAPDARIVVPTDGSVVKTVYNGPSGLKRWTDPSVRCRYVESAGYAGDILLGDRTITVTSAAAPIGGIGPGYGLTWADDVAAWIEAVGEEQAARAWNHTLKSNRERPGVMIVATTGRGVEFLARLLSAEERAGVRIHDLGRVEENAGNLTAHYLKFTVPGLRAAGEWDEVESEGAFAGIEWKQHRVDWPARLRKIRIVIDPAKSSRTRSCEVGIVATGLDERDNVLGLADRSAVLSAEQWPSVAHDLFDELRAEFPQAEIAFIVENNAGGDAPAALLRAEEKIRRLRQGLPGVSVLDVREVTARRNDGKARRAGPIVAMTKGGQVKMARGLGVLEGQLSKLVDEGTGTDRADAFVWGARDLAGITEQDKPPAVSFDGLADLQAKLPPPAYQVPRTRERDAAEWDRV
jgi:phage terminase large subunit-like protein